jgi:hypothetical protein
MDNSRCSVGMGKQLSRALAGSIAGIAVTLSALGPMAVAAHADVGVGITATPIVLGSLAAPGSGHAVGPITVVNTGSEPGTIHVWVGSQPGSRDRPVPPDWVRFDRDSINLPAGGRASFDVQVVVPKQTLAGRYQSLVYAGVVNNQVPRGNTIGTEAATRLEVTVASDKPHTAGQRVQRQWLAAGGAVLTVAASAVLIVRRRRIPRNPIRRYSA